MNALYLSHTGMTEPLGQSQVLPYLRGLAARGIEYSLVSFEPADVHDGVVETVRAQMQEARIDWVPLHRSAAHDLPTKLRESARALFTAMSRALVRRPKIVHARSHLPAAVAQLVAAVSPGARFLFDCRGMVADEYVDAGHWQKDSFNYRLTKRFERGFFAGADGVVVLTEALRAWLLAHGVLNDRTITQVVPCCVDTARFRPDEAGRAVTRSELGVTDARVVVYAGTLGSWYLEDEMARFFARLQRLDPSARLLVLTRSEPAGFLSKLRAAGVSNESTLVRSVSPWDMPRLLAAGDVGLSFIKPCFSKMGSSPTKVAEYLACGLQIVANGAIGDQAALGRHAPCVIVESFRDDVLDEAARRVLARAPTEQSRRDAQRVAIDETDLATVGIARYAALYAKMAAR